MLLLRTLAPWLLLAFFLCQQVSLSSGARNKTRGADKTVVPSAVKAPRSGNKGAVATGGGKFSLKNQMQCRWGVRDEGGAAVKLSVKCENPKARVTGGVTDMRCEYNGKPQGCPGYRSDPKGFWKQVARAIKRLQDKVCTDERAQVKAGMCKRAPRDSHFKLDITSSVMAAQSGGSDIVPEQPRHRPRPTTTSKPSNCTRADHQKKAEEYCNSSWASVCSFFFSMVQGTSDC